VNGSRSDHQDITEALYRYALGIDTRDWALYRSVFADLIDADFSSYNGRPASHLRADEWVGGVKPLFMGLAATQHTMTNPMVVIDGRRATCRMYMQAEHVLDDRADSPFFTIGGYYTDTLRRDTDHWVISAVTLTVLWRRGDESMMGIAAARGAERLRTT
jgi:hypothetical protein